MWSPGAFAAPGCGASLGYGAIAKEQIDEGVGVLRRVFDDEAG
jgi:hypothetical protein